MKKIIIISISAFILGFLLGDLVKQESIGDDGRLYLNKGVMCQDFAQSYLRTIQKTDNITDFGGDKWDMAINIETEIYKLCSLELSKESIKQYRPTALEKYQK